MARIEIRSDFFADLVLEDDGALEEEVAREEVARKAIAYLGQYLKGAEEDPLDRRPDLEE